MTTESLQYLQEGLTKQQVRQLLGPPMGEDAFQPNHWEYIFYSTESDLYAGISEHLDLEFDEDQMLKSWKRNANKKQIIQDRGFWGN
ncbi:outer membrane protein assembly factor BamE [Thiomicrorhabdus sp.]|uniref:outer membrane protein assembly factor BamE n=1 Tax=Thiomicrorhabdus sp. TaxID=2039724 RepID=UPI0029C6735B|nr:outer membrane protein assembly factor BamE [Thiomicrorhabdus sp.]